MFSRPVRSCWKPAPSSRRPASLPRTATSPVVGWSTPQMHLSRVDLPEPLRPRMPTVSPSLDRERDVVERPEVLGGLAPPAVDEALLHGVVLAVGQAEALGDVADVDGEVAHRSELLGEVALEPAEDGEGDEEEDRRRATSTPRSRPTYQSMPLVGQDVDRSAAVDRGVGRRVRVDAALERQDERHHRVQEVDPGQALAAPACCSMCSWYA